VILEIHQFKDGVPTRLEREYDAQELDLEFVDFHYRKKIALSGDVEKIGQTLTFRGTLKSEVEQVCARCLESSTVTPILPFDLVYEIGTQETIDTTDDLRDILILSHPDRFLCKTNCKGLCTKCGANLNLKPCDCKR